MTHTFSALTVGCTPDERDSLAWHLAMIRARATWEALRTRREDEPPMMELPPGGWNEMQERSTP